MSDRKIYYKNENKLLLCFPVGINKEYTWNGDI